MQEKLNETTVQLNQEASIAAKTLQQAQRQLSTSETIVSLAQTAHEKQNGELLATLGQIHSQLRRKVSMINQLHSQMDAELTRLKRGQQWEPLAQIHPSSSSLSDLEFQVEWLLRFDKLSKKRERMDDQQAQRLGQLREQIKKVKLKISLTELELNEMHSQTKRSGRLRQSD